MDLDKFTSPRITLEQGISGNWHPATPQDRDRLEDCGILIAYRGMHTIDMDRVLDTVSDKGYWLETIPAEEHA